jgi:hypothetical protein
VFVSAGAEGGQFAAHFFQGHALEDDVAGAGKSRQEKAFTANRRPWN